MATSSETYHEPYEELSPAARDFHRALASMEEELQAIDWYQQRAEVAADEELKGILLHNRDEEIEHFLMLLEWMRRRNPAFEERAKTYLMKTAPILRLEEIAQAGEAAAAADGEDGSLGIGSAKRG